ncbi:AlpA family transcriptional regulator [Synechococcus sp. MIT S9504]|uniref:helix-turn-helix transcriptional regulator n=1 Tax=Synechococcus sp. MIT S9504 TaxID=1801628 RepID=UPI00094100D7|nr:AlpA family phage regulatory protein [Synechococcus sp. MIT S9504]
MDSQKFLRLSEVKSMTGLSKSTIYQWMSQSKFPKQIPLTSRLVVWQLTAIQDWMRKQI